MSKNKLSNLNDHLFEMLEKLNDDDLVGDALKQEISRSGAMVSVAKTIVANAELELRAYELVGDKNSSIIERAGGKKCLALS